MQNPIGIDALRRYEPEHLQLLLFARSTSGSPTRCVARVRRFVRSGGHRSRMWNMSIGAVLHSGPRSMPSRTGISYCVMTPAVVGLSDRDCGRNYSFDNSVSEFEYVYRHCHIRSASTYLATC